MIFNLKGTDVELTSQIREYLDKRLQSVEKFLPEGDGSFTADIELGRTTRHHQTGDVFRAEINVNLGKKMFRAVSEGSDLFKAIDDMRDEIVRELSSRKEKHISILRRGGQKIKNLLRGLSYRKRS